MVELEIVRGDTKVYEFQFNDENGANLVLSGDWTSQARLDATSQHVVDCPVDATDQATGLLRVTVPGEEFLTEKRVRQWLWDLQGSVWGTILPGSTIKVLPDATRTGVAGGANEQITAQIGPNEVVITAQGSIGPMGPQGIQGEQGIQGPQGDDGVPGDTHVPDATGQDANLVPTTDGAGTYELAERGITQAAADAAIEAAVGEQGGEDATTFQLREWAESWQPTTITRDSDGVMSEADGVWPDASAGVLTRTAKDDTFLAVDAYEITHAASGQKVVQAAVTRNADGVVTDKPALTVEAI